MDEKRYNDLGQKILSEEIMDDNSLPYITVRQTVLVRKYNPSFGDNRKCKCGHSYYRHFDSYDDMEAVGCKHCGCNNFEEKI